MTTSTCPNCSGRGITFISQLGGGTTEICCPMCGGAGTTSTPGVHQNAGGTPVSGGSVEPSAGYQPFAISVAMEERIPLWLERLLGVLGAIALVWVGRREGVIPAAFNAVGIEWEVVMGIALTGAVGYALGAHALRIFVRLFDLSLKLLRIILVLGVILGGILLLGTFLGLWDFV